MPTQTYFEMLEMLQAEAHPHKSSRTRHVCVVCRLTLQGVDRFMQLISLENVTDVDMRLQLRASGGFCNRHAYHWLKLNDALGTAILYEDLLREGVKRIERGEFQARRSGLFGRAAASASTFTTCPVCIHQEEIETRVANDFAEGLAGQPKFREAYAAPRAAGVCLPHFRRIMGRLDGAVADEFSKQQQEKFEATRELLRQIIDKMDAGRKLEQTDEAAKQAARSIGEEREALTRAIWQMVGMEDIS